MGLARLRRSSRTVALWLLMVSLWGLPHRAAAADDCPPPGAEQHDESKHVFSSPAPDDHGEHCAVCHWLRSVKPTLTDRASQGIGPDISGAAPVHHLRASNDGTSRRLAARAPPSLSR